MRKWRSCTSDRRWGFYTDRPNLSRTFEKNKVLTASGGRRRPDHTDASIPCAQEAIRVSSEEAKTCNPLGSYLIPSNRKNRETRSETTSRIACGAVPPALAYPGGRSRRISRTPANRTGSCWNCRNACKKTIVYAMVKSVCQLAKRVWERDFNFRENSKCVYQLASS